MAERDPRRVWVLTECYPRPAVPNHCAFAHRQMAGVARTGWTVKVLVPNGWFPPLLWYVAPAWRAAARAHIPTGWSLDGVSVSDLPYQNRVPSRLCRPLDTGARISAALTRRLTSWGVHTGRDVLLCQFALPYGLAVRDAAERLRVPYAVQLRGDDVWLWSRRSDAALAAFRAVVRGASLVLGISRALVEEARYLAGGWLPPSAVVPNGIELHRFRHAASPEERAELRRRIGIAPDALVVICAAQPLVRKGWAELLDALGRLTQARIALIAAIGPGPRDEVDIAGEAARRAPRVALRVVRDAGRTGLAELYRTADVFALASHSEGLSNAVLEAMASGLAVVTTDVGGHSEAITTGVDGVLVPPRSAELLRAAIARLLDERETREALGEGARARAEAIGDSDTAGARLSRLLDGLRQGTLGDMRALLEADPYAPSEGRTDPPRDRRMARHASLRHR